ncbi:nucleotidyltransferase domain-containing protein [bacterium]|nr:nucleotidyltransferase domain-containing protein [bacterium]
MIDVGEKDLNTIRAILRAQVPECEVRAFGSRVNGTARRFSDLDLALVGADKIDWRRIMRLKEDFEYSDLPFRVDVIDWNASSETFREIIGEKFEVIQKSAPARNAAADG